MADRLAAILAHKREEVRTASAVTSQEELAARCAGLAPPRGFAQALRAVAGPGRLGVVAEAKRASPSAGRIAGDYDPAAIACAYAAGGAACLSVLTDARFFQGAPGHLAAARAACALPVLRKDFIIDAWQVHETRAMGADCMLLLAAALGRGALCDLAGLAAGLGLDVLVEVHAPHEVEAALAAGTGLVGVNSRDLATLVTDLATIEEMVPLLVGGGRVVVAESAIKGRADAARALRAGADAVLVGEALMRAADKGQLLGELARPA